jgi:cytochrome P450 family 138
MIQLDRRTEATLSIRKLLGIDAALNRRPKLLWPVRHMHLMFRAIRHLSRLPPGRLDPLDDSPDTDQLFFLKKAKVLGPVFKVIWEGSYTTCLVGHARAGEFLRAHEEALDGKAIDLRGFFPKGIIRKMSGEDRRKYRRLFVQALQATPLAFHEDASQQLIFCKLAALENDYFGATVPGSQLRLCLREITTVIMLRVLFGLTPDDPQFPVFVQNYRKFGPNAPVRAISPEQGEAFFEIRNQVQRLAGAIRRDPRDRLPSFLKFIVERDELDETALGNLIYMFEGSHFDLYSLWRWIVKHLVSNPDCIKRVQNIPAQARRHFCKAIVLETLRLEQSEYLHRVTTTDISYRHYFIPKNTVFRVCVWEGHKDPNVFPDPFRFDPERFISRAYSLEEYAPFGMDKRHCIASDFVVTLSSMFVETLLERFVVRSASDAPPQLGAYHWEPNPDFSIALSPIE